MKILLIEDEPKISTAIRRGLAHEHYLVEIYANGTDGLAAALGSEYDLMIIDRMLPGIEGVEICRQIRKHKIQTPILILTAKSQIRDRVEGLNAGADDYLIKPFGFEELLARIRALLRRPAPTTDNLLQIDNLTLDTVSHDVSRNNHKISLSRTEFALLEFLMRHPGQTFSKEKLINHVWDFDADILPNTVEAYIGYLRRKIDRAFPTSKPLIKTTRGFGYQITGNQK